MEGRKDFTKLRRPRKYMSMPGDLVLGRVINRQGEQYRVDIGDRFEAHLQFYDFEGATKRNRPQLEANTLIYARIESCSKLMSPVITCKSLSNKKSWASGEALFGVMKDGLVVECSIALCQKLLSKEHAYVLKDLGAIVAFEVVVGYNGRFWLNSRSQMNTILLANTLLKAESLEREEFQQLLGRVQSLLAS
jgi:exosome complex component RRP40